MRPDLDVIAGFVPPGARVLDLGCGDGSLLEHLIREQGCDGHGVEISGERFLACVARGVPVLQGDIDLGLPEFGDRSFDVVVLSQTLQATRRPVFVLREMMRVGRLGIVSFPNFGHWRLRAGLALRGRMPRSATLPDNWHETPNIHLCTTRDFEDLARDEGLRVVRRVPLDGDGTSSRADRWPNLLATGALYLVERPA
ncbi:MAG TPA: methionine biosynthesis protein MetW [Miltoncostaeaceae bacterium]|nr:methionine biosynthesis protein MetW [Miltoncostaeaceae bacterium]